MKNFWTTLPDIFTSLAPMDDVTDVAFRRIIEDTSSPDVFFSEFTSVDGLQSQGRTAVSKKLVKDDSSKVPLVVQVWGLDLGNYAKSAKELVEMGFDGIDINMGCPVGNVVKNGCCSALINDREKAKQIIQATRKGVEGKIPVSVKTRIGFNTIDLSWIEFLLEQDLPHLAVHMRTQKELSKVPAHWDLMKDIVEMRDRISPDTRLSINGDIMSKMQGVELAKQHGFEGVMIGRGVFQDLYCFADSSNWKDISREDKLDLFRKHIDLFEKYWSGDKNPQILKKFAKVYISGFDGAKELRESFMRENEYAGLRKVLQ